MISPALPGQKGGCYEVTRSIGFPLDGMLGHRIVTSVDVKAFKSVPDHSNEG